jgi:patatin-related protein
MVEHAPPVESIDAEDLQHLRLALVMSGGVSLAIWMGGAAHEFQRVMRGDGPVWSGLLRLTATRASIDVISGTSAGGLNGALLAMAIARDSTIGRLRELWLKLGSLQPLLRPAGEADPPALMQGDEYFLKHIAAALKDLQSGKTSPEDVPLDLTITTTLLRARPRGIPDHFGTIIRDADHRGEFRFQRGIRVTTDAAETLGSQERDDFDDPRIVDQLALASRSTASFPFAFEASFVPVKETPSDRPDMDGVANFEMSRYVVDGGVLVNRPLRPALRAIFAQPAGPQVRRVVAYVVPDPGEAKKETADARADVPKLAEIATASLVTLPRNQSVGNELDELTDHNMRVDAQRRRRELSVAALDVDAFAIAAYPQYREVRADRLTDWLFNSLSRWLTLLETLDPRMVADVPLWQRGRLKGYLSTHMRALPPATFPMAGAPVADWFTTADTVERAGMVILDLLRRGLGVTDPLDPRTKDFRTDMHNRRREVHAWMRLARERQSTATPEQQREYAEKALVALQSDKPAQRLGKWAGAVMAALLGKPEDLQPFADQIASHLAPSVEMVLAACAVAPSHLKPRADATATYAGGLVKEIDQPGLPARDAALRRLLALEVVDRALGEESTLEQRIELIQVSAEAANGFDGSREKPEHKLAGLQLGHFGAFYKQSWRANDWMWGRLDAAQRLAQILLEPSRLRQLGYSSKTACQAIEDCSLGVKGSEERTVLEKRDWPNAWDPDEALKELEFLDDPESALPDSLPVCAQALARRVQLQILRDELGAIARAIRLDEKARATISPSAATFAADVEKAEPLSEKEVVPLFEACDVGTERLRAEQGSDLLAQTVSQTLAVSTSAVSGKHAGLPARGQRFLRSLRGFALVFHLFVSQALAGSRAAGTVAAAMLAAGAALVGVGLLVRIPGILLVAGVALVLGGIVLAAYRHKWQIPWKAIVVAAVLAIGVRIAIWIWDAIDDGQGRPGWVAFLERIEPVTVVLGLVVGAHILGRSAIRWPPA